jgi:hypothetical protein
MQDIVIINYDSLIIIFLQTEITCFTFKISSAF